MIDDPAMAKRLKRRRFYALILILLEVNTVLFFFIYYYFFNSQMSQLMLIAAIFSGVAAGTVYINYKILVLKIEMLDRQFEDKNKSA